MKNEVIKKDSSNWGLVGNEKIVNSLKKTISSNKISHAYLFAGSGGLGKKIAAVSFAKTILCEKGKMCNNCRICKEVNQNKYPDFNILEKETKKIKIDEIRKIQHEAALKSNSKYKIFVINRIDNFTLEAGNALLKILEEPKGNTIFILTAKSIENILPTIISRCIIIKFNLVAEDKILKYLDMNYQAEKENNKEVARLAFGKPELAIEMKKNPEVQKERKETEKQIMNILKEKINRSVELMGEWVHHEESRVDKIEILLQWFRDVLLFKLGNLEEIITLSNIKGRYDELSKIYTINEIKDIMENIVRSKELISQNINRKLVLENLALKIKK